MQRSRIRVILPRRRRVIEELRKHGGASAWKEAARLCLYHRTPDRDDVADAFRTADGREACSRGSRTSS